MQVFGRDHRKAIILLQLQWKGLALLYKTETFLSSLSWIFILSLFYPFNQQNQIFADCSIDVNVTNRKLNFGC
jgi:hypothetical protein